MWNKIQVIGVVVFIVPILAIVVMALNIMIFFQLIWDGVVDGWFEFEDHCNYILIPETQKVIVAVKAAWNKHD